jgi:hypothetical protein
MMIRPSESGFYQVQLSNGCETNGYYISRKDMWVAPDGSIALDVIGWRTAMFFEVADEMDRIIDEGERKPANSYYIWR